MHFSVGFFSISLKLNHLKIGFSQLSTDLRLQLVSVVDIEKKKWIPTNFDLKPPIFLPKKVLSEKMGFFRSKSVKSDV